MPATVLKHCASAFHLWNVIFCRERMRTKKKNNKKTKGSDFKECLKKTKCSRGTAVSTVFPDMNFCGNLVVDNINLRSFTSCHIGKLFCILCKLEKGEQRYRKLLTLRKPGTLSKFKELWVPVLCLNHWKIQLLQKFSVISKSFLIFYHFANTWSTAVFS